MKKLIIMSIVLATFWVPIAAARKRGAKEPAKAVLKRFAWFCVIYALFVIYVLPRI